MQQHQPREDLFFHSPPLAPQTGLLPLPSPPPSSPKMLHQDIDHFLNLNSPEFRRQPSILAPDLQESPMLGTFSLGGESLIQSPLTNQCSRAETTNPLLPISSCEVPSVLRLGEQQSGSRVRQMIEFLVENSELKNDIIATEGVYWIYNDPQLSEVYSILMAKFKLVRKTKEEMTKYLMRKALKFVEELCRKQKSSSLSLPQYMRQYCDSSATSFPQPFKKQSTDKTMNSHFLKSLISCPRFSEHYRLFLEQFEQMTHQDNQKKIDYLTNQVEHALQHGQIRHIQAIKRLPWTKKVLQEAKQLAIAIGQGRIEGRRGKKEL